MMNCGHWDYIIPLREVWSGDALKAVCEHIISRDDYFSPERVFEAKEKLARLAATAELEKADKEGRLVVLPPYNDDGYIGLKVKYRVYKARNGEPVEDCFVLRPDKDVAARHALEAYIIHCDNHQFAYDICQWLMEFARADKIAELKAAETADAEAKVMEDLSSLPGLPVKLGTHLWEWNGEEIREWSVDSIRAYHSGAFSISCVDIVNRKDPELAGNGPLYDYGDDYQDFDAACIGHNLKLTREEAEAERAKMEAGKC